MTDFAQALKWLKAGKKVRRAAWGNPACFFQAGSHDYGVVPFGHWVIFMGATPPDEDARQAYFSLDDFDGTDWELFHASR